MVKVVKKKKSGISADAPDVGNKTVVQKKKKVVKDVKTTEDTSSGGPSAPSKVESSSIGPASCELCDGLVLPVGVVCRACKKTGSGES
mmetsp:Transcript_10378/g.18605  ORF Transcript_10378/g.18605 Transcript_10378/m.18605 type:complete len:88 (+) Transcript_10378:65-328(+)